MENGEHEKLLNIEKSKADVAEKGRVQLAAELDLIRKQLDMEHENIVRCKKFLEPEELAKVEESHPEKAVSPSSLEQGLTISEQILLKYKRSNELRQFFESRYQAQGEQIKNLENETTDLKETINDYEDKIEELNGKIGEFEILITT